MRLVIGLPITCNNLALLAESDLDTVEDLASKCAVSFYVRLNPQDESQTTLAKKRYKEKKPIWTKLLKKVPEEIWGGKIQAELRSKYILATDKVKVVKTTLETGEQAGAVEKSYSRILYTDASVKKVGSKNVGRGNTPGMAAAAYIWYEQDGEDNWRKTKQESFYIGTEHSSYSAEAIAIAKGLQGDPLITPITETQAVEETSEDVECADASLTVVAALLKAPSEVGTEAALETVNRRTVGIFTDSLSNLETIDGCIAETEEQKALLETIMNYPNEMEFHHVRSHRDNLKNIEVDRLCDVTKNIQGRKTLETQGTKTKEKVKCWTKEWATDRRLRNIIQNRIRDGSVTQGWIRKILQDEEGRMLPRPQIQSELPRRQGVLLAKARMNNWTSCYSYLNRIKVAEYPSPNCKCTKAGENAKIQTLEHLLNHCPTNEEPREVMLSKLRRQGKIGKNRRILTNILDLLSSDDKEIVKQLGTFLEKADDVWNEKEEEMRKQREAAKKAQSEAGTEALTEPSQPSNLHTPPATPTNIYGVRPSAPGEIQRATPRKTVGHLQ